MKHLSPGQIAAYAEEFRPVGEDAGHLRTCGYCRRELRSLRSLTRTLAEAPAPPAALRRATLERLGLDPVPRRKNTATLRWAAFLASALALAWILPLPKPWAPKSDAGRIRTTLPASTPDSTPALALSRIARSGPKETPLARARRHPPAVELARAVPSEPASKPANRVFETDPTRARAEAIGRAAPPEESGTASAQGLTVLKGGAGPASAPLSLGSIRGNLIRPGQSETLHFAVNLGQSGQVQVLVVNSLGQPVATLFDGVAGPGTLSLSWDGGSAPSGIYTILVRAGASFQSFKALVIR